MRALAAALFALGCGCGGEGAEPPPEERPGGCAAGEWPREDGSCVPAGLPPDMPCPPAEWPRDDTSCVPAGVPPDGCGAGFVHDGDRGCTAILPAYPCPTGLMAVPGETRCREVAPCALGKWGDIPMEPDSEYVDASYAGMDSDGSALKPWTSIQAAVDAASPGALVAIAEGSYLEDVTLSDKAVRLWGVCPRLVEVVGSGAAVAAVLILAGASGSEVNTLGIRGDAIGFILSGSRDVVVERVWVHGNASRGVDIENGYSATRMTARGALVEQNHDDGVFVAGSDVEIEASVVRTTQTDGQGLFGRGVTAKERSVTGEPSTLVLRRSVVEQNHEIGVFVQGSVATLESSVVRATQTNDQGLGGRGVSLQEHTMTSAPATLVLERSLVEDNHEFGVYVGGSVATIEASVVRATQPDGGDGLGGRGLSVRAHPTTGAPATLWLQRSLVEQNHEIGVYVEGSAATLEASVVRATRLNALGLHGRGIGAEAHLPTGLPATLRLEHSLVEQNYEVGIFVGASDATVVASIIRATEVNALGEYGIGISAQAYPATSAPSTLLIDRSAIELNHETGVFVVGSSAEIVSSLVRDTFVDGQSRYGHGLAVWSESGPASATITATRIEQSALAALAIWGAHTVLGGSMLRCQAFDLNTESYQAVAATLEDLGNNVCGCPEASESCKAVSAHLEPPSPLDPKNP